jgi:hypothetical protein
MGAGRREAFATHKLHKRSKYNLKIEGQKSKPINDAGRKGVEFLYLTPSIPLSPACGGIFNMKWRGGQTGRGRKIKAPPFRGAFTLFPSVCFYLKLY